MSDRAKVIHRQGSVNVMESNEPVERALRTYANIAKAIKERAKSAWGVRFEETPVSLTAIWPRSDRLLEGWRESVNFILEE
ncbi:MAG: hypothetical protein HDS83_03150 [Bacteroidales bacterium]|nr:hypothetical protein [Bacteroidales bacterium]